MTARVDDARIRRAYVGDIEAGGPQGTRPQVRNEDIGLFDETQEQSPTFGFLDIETDTAFPPIGVRELDVDRTPVDAEGRRVQVAVGITGDGMLDLDDFCAEVAHDRGR